MYLLYQTSFRLMRGIRVSWCWGGNIRVYASNDKFVDIDLCMSECNSDDRLCLLCLQRKKKLCICVCAFASPCR